MNDIKKFYIEHQKQILIALAVSVFVAVIVTTLLYIRYRKKQKMNQEPHNGIQQSTLDFLKEGEGVRKDVYKDSAGYDTVGVGHKVLPIDGLKFGDKITDKKVDEFLTSDSQKAAAAVISTITAPLNQAQFDALVSLVFNIGVQAFKTSTLAKYINEGKGQEDVSTAWLAWKWAGGKPILEGRRKKEVALFYS